MFFWVTVLLSEVEDVGKVEMSLPESIVTKCWECEVERVLYFLVYFLSDCPLLFPNGRHFHSGTQSGHRVIDSDCPKIFTNSVVQQSANVLLWH